jgi:hypothetical protein
MFSDSSAACADRQECPSEKVDPLSQSARLGWAAGFLDGEGCIHITKQQYRTSRTPTYRLGVQVTQNHLETLERFREIVCADARIYATKRAPNHKRQCYALNCYGHVAASLLLELLPHLRRKREEAEAAISFWFARSARGRDGTRVDESTSELREHYFLLLKRLK